MSDILREGHRPASEAPLQSDPVLNDPVLARVAGPGSPFEIGLRNGIRQFVSAPPDLNLMIESARRFGNRTCVVDFSSDGEERRLDYDQFFAWRDQLVPLLHVRRGDRVAIAMRNRAEWLVAFLAVMKAGGVAVLVNSRGSGPELLAMLEDVDPAVVLADTDRADAVRDAGYKGRVLDLTKPLPEDELTRRAAEPAADAGVADPEDPCAILFTSGTTGRVKGAILSHRNVITGLMSTQMSGMVVLTNMAAQMGTTVEALIGQMPQQASLLVYPLFHVSGLGAGFLSPFVSGGKVVIMRRWDADEAARLIAAEQISMFSAVPTMLWDILHRARTDGASLVSLRNIGSGGQALPVNLVEEVHALCPHAQIGTGYGMTECSGAIAQAVGPDFMRRPAAAGRVLPMVEVRIEGPEGQILAPGEAGEIVVRGAQVMKGYWNRPEETAAVLTGDGWLRTGDVGFVDEDGYVFIVDRKKDMVISGGENIYCAEVERVLGELPGLTECAAFGLPDERLGERLVAVVIAAGNDGIDEAGVIEWVAGRLARYKAPTRVAFATTTLPRNALGKVDKIALRKLWPQLSGEQ
ncbi:AMP-dependent synthetase and ligase (plasmid) [Novosphingobium aromaticivorans DSM 12444]|uniref:AMP-dependent synthetase and ligase n=1 Tax=Novosphingobium aromaticivorans (strain ATCC 700278 / DSM 12444 / CCUG 56034 / CIP 105152 / NBRC 16084 / F199) TaxID=279238 RepID=A4XEU7_NOVAD|nr:class I adenylate-forming enzyme family protein [Novosphingobium aromaticivorans]ABP64458.1 AMP-dependent synthetase and ligase [Novosphingobium aromaticivorans DSM 12444]SCY91274.1 Acyl-CoA synthetase (AMP-forming)/AMP-acid ligase II [Novosphingobium aromaticivorans]